LYQAAIPPSRQPPIRIITASQIGILRPLFVTLASFERDILEPFEVVAIEFQCLNPADVRFEETDDLRLTAVRAPATSSR
jgi:hypothetical protein